MICSGPRWTEKLPVHHDVELRAADDGDDSLEIEDIEDSEEDDEDGEVDRDWEDGSDVAADRTVNIPRVNL
jgi:hypothetical protein